MGAFIGRDVLSAVAAAVVNGRPPAEFSLLLRHGPGLALAAPAGNAPIVVLRDSPSPADPAVLALQALAHVAGDADMGPRFLALTGMDAAALRAHANQPATLAALLDYLMANEPDLVATADAIGARPEHLADAARRLGGTW